MKRRLRPLRRRLCIGAASPGFFGAAAGAGSTCPDYSTVTLQFTSSSYTPPNAGDGSAVLQFLPCSYTPPTVV